MLQIDFHDHAVEANGDIPELHLKLFMCSQCGHVFRLFDVYTTFTVYEIAACPSCWCEFIGFDKVTGVCTTN